MFIRFDVWNLGQFFNFSGPNFWFPWCRISFPVCPWGNLMTCKKKKNPIQQMYWFSVCQTKQCENVTIVHWKNGAIQTTMPVETRTNLAQLNEIHIVRYVATDGSFRPDTICPVTPFSPHPIACTAGPDAYIRRSDVRVNGVKRR